jgi:hypothetical protein
LSSSASRAFVVVVAVIIIIEEEEEKVDFSPPLLSFLRVETRAAPRKRILSDLDEEQDEEYE